MFVALPAKRHPERMHLQASLGGEAVRHRGSIWLEALGFRDAGHDRIAARNFQDRDPHKMYNVR